MPGLGLNNLGRCHRERQLRDVNSDEVCLHQFLMSTAIVDSYVCTRAHGDHICICGRACCRASTY